MNAIETRMPSGDTVVKGGTCTCGNKYDHIKKDLCTTTAEIIKVAKEEILDDITKCLVPADIKSFNELHNYVDANEYGMSVYAFETFEKCIEVFNVVHEKLDAWIKNNFEEEN